MAVELASKPFKAAEGASLPMSSPISLSNNTPRFAACPEPRSGATKDRLLPRAAASGLRLHDPDRDQRRRERHGAEGHLRPRRFRLRQVAASRLPWPTSVFPACACSSPRTRASRMWRSSRARPSSAARPRPDLGLTARGLSIRTGDEPGEEFPLFRAFWIEKPRPAAKALDHPRLARFGERDRRLSFHVAPGRCDDHRHRNDAGRAGRRSTGSALGAMAGDLPLRPARPSPSRRRRARPPIESSGLQILTGQGRMAVAAGRQSRDAADLGLRRRQSARLRSSAARARPSTRSTTTRRTGNCALAVDRADRRLGRGRSASARDPRRFGRQRQYHRPVAPESRHSHAGATMSFAYRQFWCWSPPSRPAARHCVVSSRAGKVGNTQRFAVEFVGDMFADPAEGRRQRRRSFRPRPARSYPPRLFPYKDRRSVRVVFDLDPGSETYSELRLTLKVGQPTGERDMALSMDSLTLTPKTLVSDAGSSLGARCPACAARDADAVASAIFAPRPAPLGRAALARTPLVLTRLVVFGGAVGADPLWRLRDVRGRRVGEITPLEWALVVLFVVNFSWIALAFTASVCRLLLAARARAARAARCPTRLRARRRSSCRSTTRRPRACSARCRRSARTSQRPASAHAFDYFFLSDTTDPDIWIAEERALAGDARAPAAGAHSTIGTGARTSSRKAGNIADFVTRWGGAYPHMVVLDADSLMTGEAIVRLAAAMEADPDAGIIQSLPLIINRNTLFARAAAIRRAHRRPGHRRGLARLDGARRQLLGPQRDHPHRAPSPTIAACRTCPGRPPFGGHILSHDFVEAALIRRAGYAVYMLPTLGGSYRREPAFADRPRGARPAMVPGQSAACAHHRRPRA